MLRDDQFSILEVLQRLEIAPTEASANEMAAEVCEKLAAFEDSALAAQIENEAGIPASDSREYLDFVTLAWRRIREAQLAAATSRSVLWRAERTKFLNLSGRGAISDVKEEIEEVEEKEQHVAKSEEITGVLRRIHQLAQGEVLRSEMNISELDMSSRTLRELQDKYSAVDILLNGSRKLIQVLDEADSKDRRMMLLSLGFLGMCIGWVLWRRIFGGPIKLLIWSLLRIFGILRWSASALTVSQGDGVLTSGSPPILSSESAAIISHSMSSLSVSTPPVIESLTESFELPWSEASLQELSEKVDQQNPTKIIADNPTAIASYHEEL